MTVCVISADSGISCDQEQVVIVQVVRNPKMKGAVFYAFS